ncbi:MAG: amidophosphoribosyltransferase [candidate division WOR-3 bacterium]
MCGVVGILGKGNVVQEIYEGLLSLQHRGQDGAGIITHNGMFHLKKGVGLVLDVFKEKNLRRLQGNIGIGHVRYPTIGGGGSEDTQPFFVTNPYGIAMAHNGNVTNYFRLRQELTEERLWSLNSYSDVEVILNIFADALLRQQKKNQKNIFSLIARGVREVFQKVEGSYSCVGLIAGRGLFAFRDPKGIKPLILGRKGDSYIFASESVCLDLLGYKLERDVKPGEVIFIDTNRQIFQEEVVKGSLSPCIFEYVYFARPDSVLDGISVYEARLRLGEYLGKECLKEGIKPDVVIPVPDTARAAATTVAEVLGVKLREGLIKNRYIQRTFIMPTQDLRRASVRQKLNPIKSEIVGKKILVVDDSIVRGTTSKEIISILRKCEPREIYLAITCPPLRFPCVYGIDMMTRGEFIARKFSVEKIQKMIGADRLIYQTYDGLISAVRGKDKKRKFCTACFNGEYPTKVKKEDFQAMERERCQWR